MQTPSFVPLSAPSAVITRLLMSPLAVYVGGSVDDVDGMRVMGDAVTSHVSTYYTDIDIINVYICMYLYIYMYGYVRSKRNISVQLTSYFRIHI